MENSIINKKVTVSIILDTRSHCANSNNEYPVKIRISHLRNSKYVPLKYFFLKANYEKMFATKKIGVETQTIRNVIKNREDEIIGIINNHFKNHFNFDSFFAKLKENDDIKTGAKSKDNNVYKQIEILIEKLKSENRLGTAQTYKGTLGSIKLFHNNKKLNFNDITPKFLNDYQNFMLNNKKSLTTIGIYLRTLRAVYNNAIYDGIINKELYPFGTRKGKYTIPNTVKSKESLTTEEIEKIFNYECSTIYEQKAKELFIFSFLCNGMNLADILRLKYNQLTNNKIIFVRQKTKNTTKSNQKEIQVILTNELKLIILPIIEKQETIKSPDNYIFNYLTNDMTNIQVYSKIKGITKLTNNHLKKIGEKLGIQKNISTMIARHSFVSILIDNGANQYYVKESVGHQNIKTTEAYTHSLGIKNELINSIIPKNINQDKK